MDQDPFLKQSCAPTVIIPKKKWLKAIVNILLIFNCYN
jgi:hypothetical protein